MQSPEELATAIDGWVKELGDLHACIARHFARAEPRQHALTYLKGLLGPLERKNGWQIAEWGGNQTPDGIQRLLSKAKWDADLVRDDLQRYVMEHLADRQAILIVDETGFPKQGDKSANSSLTSHGRVLAIDFSPLFLYSTTLLGLSDKLLAQDINTVNYSAIPELRGFLLPVTRSLKVCVPADTIGLVHTN